MLLPELAARKWPAELRLRRFDEFVRLPHPARRRPIGNGANYDHMYHPRAYVPLAEGGPLKECQYLTNGVTLWNVAVERQIRIKGPDALAFADLLVTRDLRAKCKVGRAR